MSGETQELQELEVSRALSGADLMAIVLGIVPWLAGIVLASGFWSTAFSIIVPPYAWYLLVEHVMTITGFVPGGCA